MPRSLLRRFLPGVCALVLGLALAIAPRASAAPVTIENKEVRLVIGEDGRALSLVHKPTGQECLAPGARTPVFEAVRHRGYVQPKVTPAHSVRREGDRLIVTFEPLVSVVTLRLRITDDYIGVTLEKIEGNGAYGKGGAWYSELNEDTLPFDELRFFQLPVKERGQFGAWLNVDFDRNVAVNVLATDPYAKIDSTVNADGRLMRATMVPDVRTAPVGAALIVSAPGELLKHIDRLEADYGLPRGVRSRESELARYSYLEIGEPVTLQNVDQFIDYAHRGGFRLVMIVHSAFAKSPGHFPFRDEYPHGMADLQAVVKKFEAAGITTGFHLHFNKAGIHDSYVTPVPDPRLNLRRHFTLAAPLDEQATTIVVFENPRNSAIDQGRRLLRFGDELIEYTSYTTEPPFRFLGCKRGAHGTTVAAHPRGLIGGLMDVDNWPVFIRFNQRTDLQHEMAVTLGRIYREAGFRFVYFDGSEDTPPPYWFTLADAQWQVYRELQPEPAFTEASNLGHFDWHFVGRATAEDASMPERVKALVRERRIPEIEDLQRNFTRNDFGWIRFRPPGEHTIGMQPDMIEFVASRGAAWGCALSIKGSLAEYAANPRLADDLEVTRRWEDARTSGWLTPAQQQELKNPDQEHTLLIDEQGNYELVPCRQIAVAGERTSRVRAFLFERQGKAWVSYWDARGTSRLALSIPSGALKLYRDLGRPLPIAADGGNAVLPAGERRYVEIDGLTADRAEAAFAQAKILEGVSTHPIQR